MRKLVELGDGRYEAFDVEGGATSWEQVLSRNKRKVEGDQGKHLAIVGDRVGLRAALADTSKVFFETLKRCVPLSVDFNSVPDRISGKSCD